MDLQVGEDRAVMNCVICNALGRKSRSMEVRGESYIRWENVKRHHLCKHKEEWEAYKASDDKKTYLAALRKKSNKGGMRIEEFFLTEDQKIEIEESDVKASVLFDLEGSSPSFGRSVTAAFLLLLQRPPGQQYLWSIEHSVGQWRAHCRRKGARRYGRF